MATAAAVAAHDEGGEDDQEGQGQQHHQAHCVEDSLVMFVRHKAPKLPKEVLHTFCFTLHLKK